MFCTKCGTQIQGQEKICPNCGAVMEVPAVETKSASNQAKSPVQEKKSHPVKTAISVIFVIIIVALIIKTHSDPYRNVLNVDNMRTVYELAQGVVLDNISTPKSAQFPDFDPEYVTQTPTSIEYDGQEFELYTVSSYVDYANMFGVEVRSNYIVEIGLPGNKESNIYYYDLVSFD